MTIKGLLAATAISATLATTPAMATNEPAEGASPATAKEHCENLTARWRSLSKHSTTANTDKITCQAQLENGQPISYSANYIFAKPTTGNRRVSWPLAIAGERVINDFKDRYGFDAADCQPLTTGPENELQKGMQCNFRVTPSYTHSGPKF